MRLGTVAVVNKQARWLGSLAGVAAAAVSIGLAELIAAFAGPQSAPVIAVGDVVVDSVPLPVKTFATSTFGTHDKTALIAGTFILLAIVAAVIGAWAVHDIRIGYAGIAAFGILGAVAAVTRPAAGFGAVFPSLIGACAGAAALYYVLRGPRVRRPDLDTRAGRRTVLIGSGARTRRRVDRRGDWAAARRTPQRGRGPTVGRVTDADRLAGAIARSGRGHQRPDAVRDAE